MGRTAYAETLDIAPSRSHRRAIVVPSHRDHDHRSSSGRSRAIFTTVSYATLRHPE
jgi:hypothetical protein